MAGNQAEFKLKYSIEADGTNATKAIKAVESSYTKSATTIQKGFKGAASEVSNIVASLTGDRLTGAASQVTSLANAFGAIPGPAGLAVGAIAGIGVAAVGAVGSLVELAQKGSEVGKSFGVFQTVTGLSAKSVSAFAFAANLSGKELTDLQRPLVTFAGLLEKAADGSDKASATVSKLGIKDLHDLEGGLQKAFTAINSTSNSTDKLNLAADAFGKKGAATMLTLIEKAHGNFSAFQKKAEELGVTLSQDDIDAAKAFGHAWETISYQAKIGVTKLALAYSGELTEAIEGVSDYLSKNQKEWENWGLAVGDVIRGAIIDIRSFNKWSSESGVGGYLKAVLQGTGLGQLFSGLESQGEQDRFRKSTGSTYNPDDESTRRFGRSAYITQPSVTGSPDKTGGDADTSSGGSGGRSSRAASDRGSRTYEEMKRFFESIGAVVTDAKRPEGSLVAGTGRLSKHGTGEAVDVRTRDKSVDEIVGIIAKAVEHGYRVYDERFAKGQPHLHFEANTLKPSTFYDNPSLYGGAGNLAALQSIDANRRNKAGGTSVLEQAKAENTKAIASWSKFVQDKVKIEDAADKQASENRLAIRNAEADKALEIIQQQLENGEIDEVEAAKRTGQIKLDLLRNQQQELSNYGDTQETIQKYNLLDIQAQTQEIANARELGKIERTREAERIKSWSTFVQQLKEAADAEMERAAAEAKEAARARVDHQTSYLGKSVISQYDEYGHVVNNLKGAFEELKHIGGDALQQFAQGIGSIVQNFELMGDAGPHAMRKLLASVLASVSAQAAVIAIMELAYGFAALTPWGAAIYGPAPMHFKAAALMGGVAVIAGLGAHAIAGNSFQNGASGGGSGSGSTSNGVQQPPQINQNPTPISRVSDHAYDSGDRNARFVADAIDRHTRTLERFYNKIDSMPAHAVITAADKQRPGIIGKQVVRDIGSHSAIGTGILKASGQRR